MNTAQASLEAKVQQFALGNFLSSWDTLSYETVIDILESPENEFWVSDERIIVWEPFAEMSGGYIAEQITDMYQGVMRIVVAEQQR